MSKRHMVGDITFVLASDYDALEAENQRLVKENWRLKLSLNAYGQHLSSCSSLIYLASNPPKRQPCNCGLESANDYLASKPTPSAGSET